MFWEKAERRAWCWGRMEEGDGPGDWEVVGGGRKFGGWKVRGLKGNWCGRASPARGEWERSASCLEAKAE